MGSLAKFRAPGAPGALAKLASVLRGHTPPLTPGDDPAAEAKFVVLLTSVLEQELPLAFHFQPIVDLRRGTTVGYEGLVRFPGDLGWSPDRWFFRSEQYGLRHELEALVTADLLGWRRELPDNCFLSINCSPSFLLSGQWEAVREEAGSLRRVVLEITENEAVSDYEPLLAKVAGIRAAGGTVAVDDAGSGYASLHHILSIRPEFVKLDRVFTSGCHLDRAKSVLIEMVGKAAGRLDAWVIAEGVENEAELDELMSLGVPLAQGFYLARPHPEMNPLANGPAAAIAGRMQAQEARRTVAHSLETCPSFTDHTAARTTLECNPAHPVAVVVDAWRRPVTVLERHPLLGIREVPSPMRVQVSTPAAEALDRALTRPAAQCYDPVVATDELGQLVGVVRIDRMARGVLAGS